jgi:hypothetical protein
VPYVLGEVSPGSIATFIVEGIVRYALGLIAAFMLLISFAFPSLVRGEELIPDEELLESDDEAFDPQEVLERLLELRRCPLDPNRASFSQLQHIPYLSTSQIRSILDHRKGKRFQKLEDLLRIQGIDPATLARARPFLRIRTTQQKWGHLRSRIALDFPRAQGYWQNLYRGDPSKIYLRLDLSADEHLRLGVLSEKDPGEKDLTDYRSLYLQVESVGPLRRAILGGFALEFGQGLVLWSSKGLWGGPRSFSGMKLVGRGLRPYTSTDENLGLHGIAMTSVLGSLELSIFFSRTRLDASMEGDEARSFYRSGLHRSKGELEKKDTLGETLVGGHVAGHLGQGKVLGLTWYRSRYGAELRVVDLARKRYAFQGKLSQVWGGHFDLVFGPLNFFGEGAQAQRGAPAFILGLLLDQGFLDTSLVWRCYSPDFCNLHSSGLATKENQNESGMFLGLIWRPTVGTKLELLVDQHRHPWRGYLLEMPSVGERFSLKILKRLGNRMTLTFRHRERRAEVAAVSALVVRKNVRSVFRSRRFQLDWKASREIELRGRFETNRVIIETKGSAERGALLLAQLKLTPAVKVSLKGVVAFFCAPSYDSRLYVCEMGPSGVARNLPLFGRGSRTSLLARFEVIEGMGLSVKYCSTHYADRHSIGEGAEELDSSVKREALIQFDWKW